MGLVHHPNVVTDGLVGCWDAGNRRSYPGTGDPITDLVGTNNGELENGAGFDSRNMGVFTFDGSNDYIDIGTISGSNPLMCAGGPISMCAWFYDISGSGGSYPYIMLKGGESGASAGYGLILASNGQIQVMGASGVWSGTATGVFNDDEWNYVVGMMDASGNMRIYLNGVLYPNSALNNTANPGTNSGDLRFGYEYNFGGYAGPLSIYNRALTAAEVLQNYHATKWRFQ